MSNYTKTVNFAAKDALTTGDANKIVKGTEIDTEFNNIATAVATKFDSTSTVAIANGGTGSTTAAAAVTSLGALPAANPSYTGTLTGGTGVINIGSGQIGKDASGNFLVGTTAATLSTNTFTIAAAKPALVLGNSTTADSSVVLTLIKDGSTASTSQLYQSFSYNSGSNGNGGISGNGDSQAAFYTTSDARLKENVVNLPSQLSNILALRPVEFDYIASKGHQIGFIAQEIQSALPVEYSNIINKAPYGTGADEREILTLDYGRLTAILWQTTKSLLTRVEILESKLNSN